MPKGDPGLTVGKWQNGQLDTLCVGWSDAVAQREVLWFKREKKKKSLLYKPNRVWLDCFDNTQFLRHFGNTESAKTDIWRSHG